MLLRGVRSLPGVACEGLRGPARRSIHPRGVAAVDLDTGGLVAALLLQRREDCEGATTYERGRLVRGGCLLGVAWWAWRGLRARAMSGSSFSCLYLYM